MPRVGSQDDHGDHQHDSRLREDGDVALRTPAKRKGFLTHRTPPPRAPAFQRRKCKTKLCKLIRQYHLALRALREPAKLRHELASLVQEFEAALAALHAANDRVIEFSQGFIDDERDRLGRVVNRLGTDNEEPGDYERAESIQDTIDQVQNDLDRRRLEIRAAEYDLRDAREWLRIASEPEIARRTMREAAAELREMKVHLSHFEPWKDRSDLVRSGGDIGDEVYRATPWVGGQDEYFAANASGDLVYLHLEDPSSLKGWFPQDESRGGGVVSPFATLLLQDDRGSWYVIGNPRTDPYTMGRQSSQIFFYGDTRPTVSPVTAPTALYADPFSGDSRMRRAGAEIRGYRGHYKPYPVLNWPGLGG